MLLQFPPPSHPCPTGRPSRGHHGNRGGTRTAHGSAASGDRGDFGLPALSGEIRRERGAGKIDADGAHFDAAEAVAPVAGDAVAVVALFGTVRDRISTPGITAVRPTAVGQDIGIVTGLIALLAGIEGTVTAEAGADALDAAAACALIVVLARGTDTVDAPPARALSILAACLTVLQTAVRIAPIAAVSIAVVACFARLADAVAHHGKCDALSGVTEPARSGVALDITVRTDAAATEATLAFDIRRA